MHKYLVISKKSSTFAPAFEKKTTGAVVQLVRIPACHAVGREFESRPHRKKSTSMWIFLCYVTRHSMFALISRKENFSFSVLQDFSELAIVFRGAGR